VSLSEWIYVRKNPELNVSEKSDLRVGQMKHGVQENFLVKSRRTKIGRTNFVTYTQRKIDNIYQSCIEINKPNMLIFNQQMVC
jgi:hypothetical protein